VLRLLLLLLLPLPAVGIYKKEICRRFFQLISSFICREPHTHTHTAQQTLWRGRRVQLEGNGKEKLTMEGKTFENDFILHAISVTQFTVIQRFSSINCQGFSFPIHFSFIPKLLQLQISGSCNSKCHHYSRSIL